MTDCAIKNCMCKTICNKPARHLFDQGGFCTLSIHHVGKCGIKVMSKLETHLRNELAMYTSEKMYALPEQLDLELMLVEYERLSAQVGEIQNRCSELIQEQRTLQKWKDNMLSVLNLVGSGASLFDAVLKSGILQSHKEANPGISHNIYSQTDSRVTPSWLRKALLEGNLECMPSHVVLSHIHHSGIGEDEIMITRFDGSKPYDLEKLLGTYMRAAEAHFECQNQLSCAYKLSVFYEGEETARSAIMFAVNPTDAAEREAYYGDIQVCGKHINANSQLICLIEIDKNGKHEGVCRRL